MQRKKIQILSFVILLISFLPAISLAKTYPMPAEGHDVIGQNIKIIVQPGDTLDKLAQRYGVSWHEIVEANQDINADYVQPEQELVIPLMRILPNHREGIVINLAELRLYYFPPGGQQVITYPVGLGRKGLEWRTPLGKTYVQWKKEKPTWHPTKAIQENRVREGKPPFPAAVPPGPDNPFGEYAIYLEKPLIVIHGTNDPRSVGRYTSSGCIRLQAPNIEELFQLVERKTPVTIINESTRAGWLNNKLYLKTNISLNLDGLDPQDQAYQNDSARRAIHQAMKGKSVRVDRKKIKQVMLESTGIPTEVGEAIPSLSEDEGDTNTAQNSSSSLAS